MKADRKTKAEKSPPAMKTLKGGRRAAPKTNGKHPLVAYEHIPIGIVEVSLDGKYMDVNEEFCRILEYSRQELLQLGIKDCTHEDDYAIDAKLYEQLIAGNIPFYRLEKRYVRKGGGDIWVELTRTLVCDAKGKPLYTVGVVLDISDRKDVERVLRDSVERLRLATGAAQMFMWEWDFQNQTYTLADNFEQVLGFSGGLLPRNKFETIWALSPQEDLQHISESFQKAVENRTDLSTLPCRVINPENGQVIWLEISAKIVYDADGSPNRMFGVAQNITENKNIQDEIKVISRMPEENPNPVMRIRPDGKVLYANPASAALLEDWLQGVQLAIPEELLQTITQAFTSGAKMEVEIGHHGTYFSFTVAPLVDSGYVNLYGKDITQRKQAEQKLRESEERFRTLANVMPSIVWTAAPDGTITYANDQWFHYVGITPEENAKGWPELVLHPDDYERCVREWTRALETVPDEYLIEVRNRRYDGQYRWFQTRAVPVRDASGKALAWYGVTTDIHERIEAERRLALLAEISEILRNLEDPHELMYAISTALGEHLRVKRVLFNEIDLEHDREIVHRDYHNGLESVAGVHKISDYSTITSAEVAAGKTVVNVDSKTDPRTAEDYERTYALSGEHSYVVVPLMRENRWVASLWVSDDAPRTWTKDEVSLLETIAERTWTVIEKLRINAELHDSEERYRFIVENTSDGIWWIELTEPMPISLSEDEQIDWYYKHAVIRQCNLGMARMYGYDSIEEVVGLPIRVVMPRENPVNMELSRQFIRSGYRLVDAESRERDREGRELVFLNNMVGILEDGKLKGEWGTNRDITERKRAEEALRASESLYRTIARSIPGGGVYVIDKDFRYLVAEGPVTQAFGLSREILEGHTVSEVFAKETSERMIDRLQRNFAGETVSFETAHNGRFYWTQQAPLLDSIGHAIVVTLDITERKRAEEALRQSEERFARFMQHLPGLAWIKDMQGRYVYANAATEKAFSTPREQLYGRTDEEIFPPETAAQFKQNDQRALMEGEGVQVVETLKHQDGVLHHSLVTKFPIPGLDGSTALIGGTAFDITERLRADEALRESEERFRAILRQATAGILRKDADGYLIYVNEAFCNMLGRTEAELLGKTIWDFMHPEDIAENKRAYERLMLEGIPFKLERRLLRADGSIIWVDASVSPIMDADGRPQSAVAVEVDITGRKQAEEALQQLNLQLEDRVLSRTAKLRAVNQTLREEIAERKKIEEALRKSEAAARENEAKLSTLFELLPVGISFLDLQGQILQLNPALANILMLSKEQLADGSYRARKYIRANGTLMPPTEFASQRALTEGKTVYNLETGVLLEDGELVWTSVSAAPVNVADVGAVVVTVDISESKRVERALQESRERLQILSQRLVEVQEEERRAIARELHDRVGQTLAALNINLIIVNSQLEGKVDEQINSRLSDTMKLVAETIALVRDVMSNLRPSVLDDYGLEAAIESHLSQYMARYEIHVKFEKPPSPLPRLGPSIEMTFLRIAQEALMNIAKHAEASQVTLRLQNEENAVRMTIQDNGIGIDWQEANQSGSHGLTIMRERAEAFGGNLRVSSIPSQGTQLDVRIPVQHSNSPPVPKEMSQ